MVIYLGERLPGDRRTARLSVRVRRCGTVAAGTVCLRDRCGRYRLPAGPLRPVPSACGYGAAAVPATGGLPPIGCGQAAAPKSPSSSTALPQLQAATLAPPHELPQRIAVLRGISQDRNSSGTLLDGTAAAPSTIRRNRTILYNALEYAVERRLLTRNPIKAIKWKAPKNHTRG